MTTKVTVWFEDQKYSETDKGAWIVDIDDGIGSATQAVFEPHEKEKAIEAARKLAAEKNLEMEVQS